MTKRTDTKKLGFARSEPEADTRTATWGAAQSAFMQAFAAWQADDGNDTDIQQVRHDARDRLFGTPAPDGSALAYKLAVLSEPADMAEVYDGWTKGQGVTPEEARKIIDGADDTAKAFLACYFDALALSGVMAPVAPPPVFVSPELQALIEAYERADKAHSDAASAEDAEGAGEAERKALEAASRASSDAYLAVVAFPPRTFADIDAKLSTMLHYNGRCGVHEADIESLRQSLSAARGPVQNPDAELLALEPAWERAMAGWNALYAKVIAADDWHDANKPAVPEAMKWREGDRERFGTPLGREYAAPGDINGPRGLRYWASDEPETHGAYAEAYRARAAEIVTAYDAWHTAEREVFARSGYDAAEAALTDYDDRELTPIELRIIESRAHTMDGLRLKARVADRYLNPPNPERPDWEETLTWAIVRDLLPEPRA